MYEYRNAGNKFRPVTSIVEKAFYVFLIALSIFILGVQIGIKHGRDLQKEDICIEYGYCLPN